MHHFFVEPEAVGENSIEITGGDVRHIKNVLRMTIGEELLISNGLDAEYLCKISDIDDKRVIADIISKEDVDRELDTELYLFQCMPKSDKLELIIQKAVELGAKAIIPVNSKRVIVKLEEKKIKSKVERWNSIALSAAKQSKRTIIPEVYEPISFKQAIEMCKSFDKGIMPYENQGGMEKSREIVDGIKNHMKVGIFIGPEGGFDESEVEYAMENGIEPISLGKRILRTETAGLTILSILMFKLENN